MNAIEIYRSMDVHQEFPCQDIVQLLWGRQNRHELHEHPACASSFRVNSRVPYPDYWQCNESFSKKLGGR